MNGCLISVVISLGSDNQGITVSTPVAEYARELQVPEDKVLRVPVVSNLASIHIRRYINVLFAFCGAVPASCGVGAGISFPCDGDYAQISRTITNVLDNVGGIVYNSVKPGCTIKIVSSLYVAILTYHTNMSNRCLQAGEDIVENDIEETIKNMGHIGRVGIHDTGREILCIMINEVNVDDYIRERT